MLVMVIIEMRLIAPAPGTRLRGLKYSFSFKPLLSEAEQQFYDCLDNLSGQRCHLVHTGIPLLRVNVWEVKNLPALVEKLSLGWQNRCLQLASDKIPA